MTEHDQLLQGWKSTQTGFLMNSNGPEKRCSGSKCAVVSEKGSSAPGAHPATPFQHLHTPDPFTRQQLNPERAETRDRGKNFVKQLNNFPLRVSVLLS